MTMLKLPKFSRAGLKIYCRKCRQNNTSCNHFEHQVYRMCFIDRKSGKHRSKILKSTTYNDALVEGIQFRNEVERSDVEIVKDRKSMNYPEALVRYDNYLRGRTQYAHLTKSVSDKHRKEVIRYCEMFGKSLKRNHNLRHLKPGSISNQDVSIFYQQMGHRYSSPKTFNKVLTSLTSFYKFLIEIEELPIRNLFKNCVRKHVSSGDNLILTKGDFNLIIDAVERKSSLQSKRSDGRRDNMYEPWLTNAFKLFLYLGGRREEILNLKWSDVIEGPNGILFFRLRNYKVERMLKREVANKFVPISSDLLELLVEMGYDKLKGKEMKLIDSEEKYTINTLMEKVSKAFTHFREQAGIETPYTLKHLRKTYLTWLHHALGEDSNKVSSHTSMNVLEKHYINPLVLNIDHERLLSIKVFGKSQKSSNTLADIYNT